MELKEIIKQIANVSKVEIKRVAPKDCEEIKDLILRSTPDDPYEKMVVGYLTSICAECMNPDTFHLRRNNLDYIGFELEKGTIETGTAGKMLGTCMKGGKIKVNKAGGETGSSMNGGEIIADEIMGIGNTLKGKIIAGKVGTISKNQGAEIIINGVKYKRSLLDRLLGK
ncbi:MAG: hypothetical protein C3F06_14390 [Candidatus Methanoperedenaceae archaeon]|nr:MAG: hypothetical protein C3F06_14390 [Candidatus Methanoperedenaceae archaeon]